jgi:hypothetical protein
MVSRRKSIAASEQPPPPDEISRGGLPAEGAPADTAPAEDAPGVETANVDTNEPPLEQPRKRSPRPRTRQNSTGAKAEAGETTGAAEPRGGDNAAGADLLEFLKLLQQMSQDSQSQSDVLASEIRNTNLIVESLSRGVEANDRRLQTLWQDAQESQTQLIQHTALLNDLIQMGQAVSQQEEEVWTRIATVSEGFRQASDRLLESMAEHMLRMEAKVDDMTLRLAALERQLEATQAAIQENWADLRSVGHETLAAAEQLEVVQRECQDTAEMLKATRQEIQATQQDVDATGDAVMEEVLQVEEARRRSQESQNGTVAVSPFEPAQTDNQGRLGLTVDSDALVVEVVPGSSAAEAGLQQGDRITAVDGQPINKGVDLPAIITKAEMANELTIEIMRGETTQLLSVRPIANAPST